MFYLMQYSLSNLNAFVLLISVGFSLYSLVNKGPLKDQYKNLLDLNNSPIQLTSQLKGYFYLNPLLALSLAITLFSFVGIPPLMGFFAKQMVLSAALDSGFVFLTLIAILTSVISAVYYLNVIKQIFFDEHEYRLNQDFEKITLYATVTSYFYNIKNNNIDVIDFKVNNITLSSFLTITISILTLMLLLFIFMAQSTLNIIINLALMLFNP